MGLYEQLFGQALGRVGQSQSSYYQALQQRMAATLTQGMAPVSIPPSEFYRSPSNIETRNPEGTLALIKKSIKEIKAEAVSEEAQGRVRAKIGRLLDLGAQAQAGILETELQVRVKLMRVQEWDYKVLPYEAIEEYVEVNKNWDGIGGHYKVHIDLLENYCGTAIDEETKDKIMPDNVLDKVEEAKGRQVFDTISVLWVEKVKDPLLLGSIEGCKDYFLITEWGNDVSFDEIMKDN